MFPDRATRCAAAAAVTALVPCGLMPDTLIDTAEGWRPASALVRGTEVHTVDGGLRSVAAVRQLAGPGDAIRIPGGSFGADDETWLSPGQMILLDTGAAMGRLNVPVALVRAGHLVGHRGVRRGRAPSDLLFQPVLQEEEVLFASTGLRLFAPGRTTDLEPQSYPVLTHEELREVLR
ncbi:hypothetical protein GCM10011392_38320 [Wenxinia marina]|nr:hypothetical protein GCM10011392_38320 [Wenxinia marina]